MSPECLPADTRNIARQLHASRQMWSLRHAADAMLRDVRRRSRSWAPTGPCRRRTPPACPTCRRGWPR